MPDISSLPPTTEADYARVAAYLMEQRQAWERDSASGLTILRDHLAASGYAPPDVVVSGRLKATEAIVAKMRRFGEPLRVMLDIWGYRVVVPARGDLDDVAACCAGLWEKPTPEELLLRHGALQFDWWRDYRKRDHAGLSPATTDAYDEAIHLNRRAPFGIVEIQVMTRDLYNRVHGNPDSDDSHDHFVSRRQALFRDQTP